MTTPALNNATTIIDATTGITFTRYRGEALCTAGWRTRYRIAKPDGTQLDMSISEWLAVVELADRWKGDEDTSH